MALVENCAALSASDGASDVVLRYRRRAIGAAELEFLEQVIAEHGSRGRVHVSRVVCEAWGWRQPNGQPSLAACRDLLKRLDDGGHIDLPRARGARGSQGGIHRRLPVLPRESVPLAWYPLGPDDIDLDDVEVRPAFAPELKGWRTFVDRYHYLGAGRMVGENLKYVASSGGELVALIGWSAAALHVPARDDLIGWSQQGKRGALHLVANNTRYLVPPWIRKPHLASKVLALCLRRLSSDWIKAWGHPVYLAETFVDPQRYRGVTYRAANWQHIGRTAGQRRLCNAYLHDSSPKDIYVYPLWRHAYRRLLDAAARALASAADD